jgi:hypothetical protein
MGSLSTVGAGHTVRIFIMFVDNVAGSTGMLAIFGVGTGLPSRF